MINLFLLVFFWRLVDDVTCKDCQEQTFHPFLPRHTALFSNDKGHIIIGRLVVFFYFFLVSFGRRVAGRQWWRKSVCLSRDNGWVFHAHNIIKTGEKERDVL